MGHEVLLEMAPANARSDRDNHLVDLKEWQGSPIATSHTAPPPPIGARRRMAAVNQASGTAETCSFAVAAIFTGDTQPSIRAKRLD
jgi:hypothetical protein